MNDYLKVNLKYRYFNQANYFLKLSGVSLLLTLAILAISLYIDNEPLLTLLALIMAVIGTCFAVTTGVYLIRLKMHERKNTKTTN